MKLFNIFCEGAYTIYLCSSVSVTLHAHIFHSKLNITMRTPIKSCYNNTYVWKISTFVALIWNKHTISFFKLNISFHVFTKSCHIQSNQRGCQIQLAVVTNRKWTSKIFLGYNLMWTAPTSRTLQYLPALPHETNGALNGAGAAGVAVLLWPASLSQPCSIRALLS